MHPSDGSSDGVGGAQVPLPPFRQWSPFSPSLIFFRKNEEEGKGWKVGEEERAPPNLMSWIRLVHPKCYLETKSITVVQISLVSHCADGQETAIVALFFFPDEQRWFPCRLRRSLSESCCTTVSNLVLLA